MSTTDEALTLAATALRHAPKTCPYHGRDFERSGMAYRQPRCESCRQPWRVSRALDAIDAVQRAPLAAS